MTDESRGTGLGQNQHVSCSRLFQSWLGTIYNPEGWWHAAAENSSICMCVTKTKKMEKNMSQLPELFELSDAELDAVTGGQVRQAGLVNVGLHLQDIEVDIPIDIEVREVQVGVAAFGSRVIQRQ